MKDTKMIRFHSIPLGRKMDEISGTLKDIFECSMSMMQDVDPYADVEISQGSTEMSATIFSQVVSMEDPDVGIIQKACTCCDHDDE